MRNAKRFLSVLLAMVMLLCVLPVMQASALSKTADEAIAWCQSKVGQPLGGQCVELINQYCSFLGTSAPRVNAAKDFATWAPPAGFSRIQGAQPQKGDVLIFTGGQYGHVCIYESDYVTYHQNYNIKYPYCKVERITTYYRNLVSGYWGVLRPEFSSPFVDIGHDFWAYIIKSDSWIHLENTGSNLQLATAGNDSFDPKQNFHFIRQNDGSYIIKSAYDDKCIEIENTSTADFTNIQTREETGTEAQRFYVIPNNGFYYIQSVYCDKVFDVENNSNVRGANIQLFSKNESAAQRFSIYGVATDGISYSKPAYPDKTTVSIKSIGTAQTSTVIQWTNCPLKDAHRDSRTYDIRIRKGNEIVKSKQGLTECEFECTLPAGTYTAEVCSVNCRYYEMYTVSDRCTFTIKDCTHTWNSGTVTKAATCIEEGVKTLTCTVCGTTTTEPIQPLGHTAPDASGNCERCGEHLTGGCPWCGGNHDGFFGWLTRIIHNILAAIFGAKY